INSCLQTHTLFPYTTLFRSFNAERDLNSDEDDLFNDETSSLVVYPNPAWEVKWKLYRDSTYQARFDVMLGAGRFPSLVPINVAKDRKSTRLNSSHQIISYAV